MAATRQAMLARHWIGLGHDVRVVAVDLPKTGVTPDTVSPYIHYLGYREPGRSASSLVKALGRLLPTNRTDKVLEVSRPAGPPAIIPNHRSLRIAYRQFAAFPDRYASWINPATRLALSWLPGWRPNIIYSCGPPHSGHIAASRMAAQLEVPWIAELTDLWVGEPYEPRHPLVRPFYNMVGQRVLSRADACVAVTRSATESLRALTRRPVTLSYNGYSPEDFDGLDTVGPYDAERLTILHAGSIYVGRRDPAPLFNAISLLGPESAKIRCLFFDDPIGTIATLARASGISHLVEIRDKIPRPEILRLERQVDVLLECRWVDPAGDGVIPGKLFEYIGARRPVLSIGSLTGEAAQIVRAEKLGLTSNDASEIAAWLRELLNAKSKTGRVPDIESATAKDYRWETAFAKVDELIDSLMQSRNSNV
jgi:hypothetical protein